MKISKLEKLVIASLLMCNVGSGIQTAEAVEIKIGASSTDPSSYSSAQGIGVDATSFNRALGTDVSKIVTWTGSAVGGISGIVYGIKVTGSSSVSADSISDGIDVKSTAGHAYAISLEGTGTNTISGLGSITAETTAIPPGVSIEAYGIYAKNTNTDNTKKFSVSFVDAGGSISAYSAKGENYGIKFDSGSTGTSEVLNVNEITAGVSDSNVSTGMAYGIASYAGVNTVTFTGADSSIKAKSNGGDDACGIKFEGTGTTTIIGIDSIQSENIGSSKGNAFGVSIDNRNSKFSVTMDDGTISAYSASSYNYGIIFLNTSTGNSEVKNVNKIEAGFSGSNVSTGRACGIYAQAGNNIITFTGTDSSITAKSSKNFVRGISIAGGTNIISGLSSITATASNTDSTTEAFGIYVSNGNTTVSGLKSISVTHNTSVNNMENSLYVTGGTLILQPSETKTVDSYMTANAPVSLTGGKLVFDLPAACAKDDVILKITGGTGSQLTGGTIAVINGRAKGLKTGDTVTLIEDTADITFTGVSTQHSSDGIKYVDAKIALDSTKKKLIYEVEKIGLDPDGSKAPVEGMAAAAGVVNTTADIVTGAGMANMITSTAAANGAEPFAVASIGSSRLETGSHVDSKGYGIVVGVGKKVFDKVGNKTTGGLFVEYGNSDFDTYNNAVTGSGKGINKGLGYMMRWDNKKSGNYYEGMLHGGKINTSWSNSTGGYNMNPTYFGGALTYGHKFMVEKDRQLSVYGSYLYNRTGGGDAKIADYNYSFGATNSHRTKVGVRYAMSDLMDTKKFRPYVGLAWEHEYKGDSTAIVRGLGEAPSPSMKGDSGILEFGCKQEVGKWTLGVGAELFAGKRRGWNGTLQATYNF